MSTYCFDRLVILRSRSYVFGKRPCIVISHLQVLLNSSVTIIVMGILWVSLLSADAFMKEGFRTVQECEVLQLQEVENGLIFNR